MNVSELVIIFIKFVLVILVIILTIWCVLWYVARPANDFCSDISDVDSIETVILKANSFGYSINDSIEKTGKIKVIIINNPFLKFMCVIDFQNRHVINKEVFIDGN